jgi:hypothetical protein
MSKSREDLITDTPEQLKTSSYLNSSTFDVRDILFLLGVLCIVLGGFLITPYVGLILLGSALVYISLIITKSTRPKK